MKNRAESSGIRLTARDAAIVKGMITRGDRHHDIAAWFGVNQGRIAEVKNGLAHTNVKTAEDKDLPPKGPYSSGRAAHKAMQALEEANAALSSFQLTIGKVLTDIRRGHV